jgi:hypothetical protein
MFVRHIGMAEARVRELRQLVNETRSNLAQMTINEISSNEDRCACVRNECIGWF